VGWLHPGDAGGRRDDDVHDRVLPALRIADLLQRMDHDLYGGYVILDEPASARHGLVAVNPDSFPDPSSWTALRNLLYAIQWWVFGGFAVFLWWRWCTDELIAVRRAGAEQEAAESPAPSARIPSEP
jgi:surfeit locus 1 family protein